MDRDQALSKIKKCLELAKSANQTEAATALRQAQALMREHGLDEQGIELASVTEHDVQAKFLPMLTWEAELISMVAEAFGCDVISTWKIIGKPPFCISGLMNQKRTRHWRLIGINAAPEVAAYTFDVLGGQCVRARLAHMRKQSKNCKPATKTARGDAFALGWVRGVQALIERFANGERNQALIDAYKRERYPNLEAASPKRRDLGRNVKDDALHGRQAARSATLHHGVGSPLERKLIGAS